MFDQLAFELLHLLLHLRIVLYTLEPLRHFGRVMLAQRVFRVGQNRLHFVHQRLGQPCGQRFGDVVRVIELVGHPDDFGIFAARHEHHALSDQPADGGRSHPLGYFFERGVEHTLVVIAQGEKLDQLRRRRHGVPLAQLPAHETQ